jgi:cytosine/adenosine deaminase-related metal-dependent hydrolase
MFRGNEGPMANFMRSIGRDMSDCCGYSSFSNLMRHALIKRDWILVHLNELGADDFALIESTESLRGMQVVHCPQSHQYFLHRPFQIERLRKLGANISLGTDSLASGETLSLFAEMRLLRQTAPGMGPYEILEMVTKNPARALRHQGRLGEITPGAYADLIALPFSAKLNSVYDEILEQVHPVRWLMSHGKLTG